MIKRISIIVFAVVCVFSICGCNDVYYGGEATANASANEQLRKMQNIQTIQFECLEHPEYRTKLPESITTKYTKEEIKQAFVNLKWEYKE